jgi:hypothetical protein
MATIGNNFNAQQVRHQATVRADMNQVDSHEAGHAAQTGGSGIVGKKAAESQTKKPGESFQLSKKAQLALDKAEAQRAKDLDESQDVHQQSTQDVADNALQGTKRRRTPEDDEKKVATRDVKKKKSAVVFQLDDDGNESYEVTETQSKSFKNVDDKSPEQILAGMPEGSRKAAKATLDTQLATQPQKVKDLKDDPKITAVAEQLDLDPAETLKESARVAPIRDAKNEPPMMREDPNHEVLAKEAARRQMQSGQADEAMIA